MKIEMSSFGKYKVVKILEKFDVAMDYDDFKNLFKQFLKQGDKFIAVNFADVNYITSSLISVLLFFYREVKEEGGDLCLIAQNDSLLNIFEELNLRGIISIFTRMEDIPG